MSEHQQSESTNHDDEFFNLITTGVGYLNRWREVPVKQTSSYPAVDISGMEGSRNDLNYTYFSARINGSDAIDLLKQYNQQINGDPKVLVGFVLGGLTPGHFTYKKGDHQGETRDYIQTRLLRIKWLKVKSKDSQEYVTHYTEPERTEPKPLNHEGQQEASDPTGQAEVPPKEGELMPAGKPEGWFGDDNLDHTQYAGRF